MLRYTSTQSYQLLREELPLPSISLLKKITSGNIDALSCAKHLKLEGKISQDIWLIFDEMYLQKCEEYFVGEMIGSDESGELYNGIVCFMIVGLKQNIPYVIKSSH